MRRLNCFDVMTSNLIEALELSPISPTSPPSAENLEALDLPVIRDDMFGFVCVISEHREEMNPLNTLGGTVHKTP